MSFCLTNQEEELYHKLPINLRDEYIQVIITNHKALEAMEKK